MKADIQTLRKDGVPTVVSDRAVKLLASTIFRQLQEEGCAPKDIISVSSKLIDLVTVEITKDEEPAM